MSPSKTADMEHDDEDEEDAELAAAEEAELLDHEDDEDDVEGALDLEDGAAGEVRSWRSLLGRSGRFVPAAQGCRG